MFVLQLKNKSFEITLRVKIILDQETQKLIELISGNSILKSIILQAEILQNSEEARVFPHKHSLRNMNQLRMS